eukprot:1799810-Pleurochrysis_carterae.AAC.9
MQMMGGSSLPGLSSAVMNMPARGLMPAQQLPGPGRHLQILDHTVHRIDTHTKSNGEEDKEMVVSNLRHFTLKIGVLDPRMGVGRDAELPLKASRAREEHAQGSTRKTARTVARDSHALSRAIRTRTACWDDTHPQAVHRCALTCAEATRAQTQARGAQESREARRGTLRHSAGGSGTRRTRGAQIHAAQRRRAYVRMR